MKIIKKVLSIILKIITLVIGVVVEFTEDIKGVFKFMFEAILFILLLITCPIWLLPYTVIMKKKFKKYEKEYNDMCLGLANGFVASANVVPDDMQWGTGLEAYIEKKKVKFSARLEDYNVKGNRMSKNRNRGV